MSLQITVISLVSVSCTWSSRNFYLSLPWERGVALLQIPFCGGWTYIDKLIWGNSGISTNEEFSHVWLRTLGGGGLWCHFRLPEWPACSLGYQGQVFDAYPWGRYPHRVGPGEAGKVVARVRTWSPLRMWHSLLAPRVLSLTTVTSGSAFAPGRMGVILSGC